MNKKNQFLKNLSLAFLLAGVIILLIAAYYSIVKAGIPYQDPPPELQIQYAVNAGIGDELFKTGLIVAALGILGRMISRILDKRQTDTSVTKR